MPTPEPAKGMLEAPKLVGYGVEPENGLGLKVDPENEFLVPTGTENGSGEAFSYYFLK